MGELVVVVVNSFDRVLFPQVSLHRVCYARPVSSSRREGQTSTDED